MTLKIIIKPNSVQQFEATVEGTPEEMASFLVNLVEKLKVVAVVTPPEDTAKPPEPAATVEPPDTTVYPGCYKCGRAVPPDQARRVVREGRAYTYCPEHAPTTDGKRHYAKDRRYKTKEYLYQEYTVKGRSAEEIARENGVGTSTITRWLTIHQTKRRSLHVATAPRVPDEEAAPPDSPVEPEERLTPEVRERLIQDYRQEVGRLGKAPEPAAPEPVKEPPAEDRATRVNELILEHLKNKPWGDYASRISGHIKVDVYIVRDALVQLEHEGKLVRLSADYNNRVIYKLAEDRARQIVTPITDPSSLLAKEEEEPGAEEYNMTVKEGKDDEEMKKDVLDYLAEKGGSASSMIRADLGMSHIRTQKLLSELIAEKKIEHDKGTYRLPGQTKIQTHIIPARQEVPAEPDQAKTALAHCGDCPKGKRVSQYSNNVECTLDGRTRNGKIAHACKHHP